MLCEISDKFITPEACKCLRCMRLFSYSFLQHCRTSDTCRWHQQSLLEMMNSLDWNVFFSFLFLSSFFFLLFSYVFFCCYLLVLIVCFIVSQELRFLDLKGTQISDSSIPVLNSIFWLILFNISTHYYLLSAWIF